MEVSRDPAASRYEHVGKGLRRSNLSRDPIKQFGNWFTAAIEAGIRDVNAMSLATAGRDSRPSVRIVLLKSFDHDGFRFPSLDWLKRMKVASGRSKDLIDLENVQLPPDQLKPK